VQYLLRDADAAALGPLRSALSALGDSVAVAGGDGLHNVHVHVHVQGIGPALEAGLEAGRPFDVRVTRFPDDPVPDAPLALDALPVMNERPAGRVVLAVASGEGLTGLFREAGATVLDEPSVDGPSADDLLHAVLATGAPEVVLLPNSRDLAGRAADAAERARASGTAVAVVASRSPVQGLAALAVAGPGLALADDAAAMSAAAEGTRCAGVASSVPGAAAPGGRGDVVGLLDGRVVHRGLELPDVTRRLLEELLDGAELLTAVLGADAPDGLGDLLRAQVGERWPEVELAVVDGGQPHVLLMLGAE